MDKPVNNWKISGLRDLKPAGQALYRPRTASGQQKVPAELPDFSTNAPVDMQQVVHIRVFYGLHDCLQNRIVISFNNKAFI